VSQEKLASIFEIGLGLLLIPTYNYFKMAHFSGSGRSE
jgi:hypothetical protein